MLPSDLLAGETPPSPASPPTADAVIDALIREFFTSVDWIVCPELRIGTGYGPQAEQRIDLWAMHCWPSEHFQRWAFEVKVSRSDWLAELKTPHKHHRALTLSNVFYVATPPGLVRDGELPAEAGLIEVTPSTVTIRTPAPHRDTGVPTWRFLAAVARHQRRRGRQVAEQLISRDIDAWREKASRLEVTLAHETARREVAEAGLAERRA